MDTVGLDTSHTEKDASKKKKKKKKKVIQKRNRNTAEITLFKGKITIFKHTSYLSYALSSPMLMKSLVFAIWREFKK